MTTPDDIRRAKHGDREALDRLLARNHLRLSRIAGARLGAGLRARVRTSDVLQSTYLEVVKGIGAFAGEDEESFVGWVGRVLVNNIRDKRRYYDARKRRDEESMPEGLEESLLGVDRAPGPGSRIALGEELVLVGEAMDRLPLDFGEVIRLRLTEGRSHREIAILLGRTESSIRVLLTRARAELVLQYERLRRERQHAPGDPHR